MSFGTSFLYQFDNEQADLGVVEVESTYGICFIGQGNKAFASVTFCIQGDK